MRYKVLVWGKPVDVETYQKSKSVWIASGTYMGETFEVPDRTSSAAADAWRKAATSRGS